MSNGVPWPFFTTASQQQSVNVPRRVVQEEKGSGVIHTFSIQNQYGACGVGNGYGFYSVDLSQYTKSDTERTKNLHNKQGIADRSGGCGYLSIGFIDTPECKAVYKQLKEYYPILYQSPIRFNVNSGNNFFFCIFDTGEKDVPEQYTNPDHVYYDEDHNPGFPNGLEW